MCNPWNGRYRSPHEIYGFRTMCNGGMANYMKYVHNSRIHKVPHDIPPEVKLYDVIRVSVLYVLCDWLFVFTSYFPH